MPPSHRERFASLLHREIAPLLTQIFHPTRYGLLTVTGVKVTGECDSARVFVSCLKNGHNFTADAATHVFALQKALNARMHGQKVPRLILERDTSAEFMTQVGDLPDA